MQRINLSGGVVVGDDAGSVMKGGRRVRCAGRRGVGTLASCEWRIDDVSTVDKGGRLGWRISRNDFSCVDKRTMRSPRLRAASNEYSETAPSRSLLIAADQEFPVMADPALMAAHC